MRSDDNYRRGRRKRPGTKPQMRCGLGDPNTTWRFACRTPLAVALLASHRAGCEADENMSAGHHGTLCDKPVPAPNHQCTRGDRHSRETVERRVEISSLIQRSRSRPSCWNPSARGFCRMARSRIDIRFDAMQIQPRNRTAARRSVTQACSHGPTRKDRGRSRPRRDGWLQGS